MMGCVDGQHRLRGKDRQRLEAQLEQRMGRRGMVFIRMLETRCGTADGFTTKQYKRGEIYLVTDTLARRFINAGAAREDRSACASPQPA